MAVLLLIDTTLPILLHSYLIFSHLEDSFLFLKKQTFVEMSLNLKVSIYAGRYAITKKHMLEELFFLQLHVCWLHFIPLL